MDKDNPLPLPEWWPLYVRQQMWARMDYLQNGCVQWLGARTKSPSGKSKYAIAVVDGKTRVLHRWLYLCLKDENIDEDLHLDHTCKNQGCINYVEHLEPVTAYTNVIERGIGVTAMQAKKTRCPRGHEYDYINTAGSRTCTKCQYWMTRNSKRRRAGLPEEWPDWWTGTATRDDSGNWTV